MRVSILDSEGVYLSLPIAIGSSRVPSFGDTMERAAGAVFLLAASPVIATSAGIVSILSRRSPFIAHQRVGERGELLWVWKLRTMWTRKAPEPREKGWVEYIVAEPIRGRKSPSDRRVTSRFAKLMRRYSIDELPQFWHVARGEMSLVGPRPEMPSHARRFSSALPEYPQRLTVRPGLTGLAQVRGWRGDTSIRQRLISDLEYASRRGVALYFTILAKTVAVEARRAAEAD